MTSSNRMASARRVGRVGVAALLLLLAGCDRERGSTAPSPVEIGSETACHLDGMLLAEYPGPKAQIHYEGQAEPAFFCDTVEMFAMLLRPEQVRVVRAVFVQDMGRAEWTRPIGAWIDAKSGFYVLGSRKHGSMGPTIASFAQEADAVRFAGQHGGKVLKFADVKPEMVDLSGGALHDSKM